MCYYATQHEMRLKSEVFFLCILAATRYKNPQVLLFSSDFNKGIDFFVTLKETIENVIRVRFYC